VANDGRFVLEVHLNGSAGDGGALGEIVRGLQAAPRTVSPKYFYDSVGCGLYEQITELDEYYQARTEIEILVDVVDGIMARHRPVELVELGSGSSRKTRVLLDALERTGTGHVYMPFDVSEEALREAGAALVAAYPDLEVRAIAGDFDHHLREVPRPREGTRRMVAFLGGTIGNIAPDRRGMFLTDVAAMLGAGDVLLMGVDLDTDPERTRRAYDDDAGVTAAFNRNILTVLNREAGGDFVPDDFAHVAIWNPTHGRVEMRLRARRPMRVRLARAGVELDLAEEEEILTEICGKFNRGLLADVYGDAGLELIEWHADADERFAVTLARRAR
jgi:L-histidine N-alpha-methyltransferase